MSLSKCIVRVISVLRFHYMQGMLDKKLAGSLRDWGDELRESTCRAQLTASNTCSDPQSPLKKYSLRL